MPIELILVIYLSLCFFLFLCTVFGMFNARNDRLSMIANAYVIVLEKHGRTKIPSVSVRTVLEVIKKIHEERSDNS